MINFIDILILLILLFVLMMLILLYREFTYEFKKKQLETHLHYETKYFQPIYLQVVSMFELYEELHLDMFKLLKQISLNHKKLEQIEEMIIVQDIISMIESES